MTVVYTLNTKTDGLDLNISKHFSLAVVGFNVFEYEVGDANIFS